MPNSFRVTRSIELYSKVVVSPLKSVRDKTLSKRWHRTLREHLASDAQDIIERSALAAHHSRSLSSAVGAPAAIASQEPVPAQAPQPVLREHAITVRPGDSLYTLFKARGLAQKSLAAIMATGKSMAVLARLRPGDRITVYTDAAGRVQGLSHARPRGKTLNVVRDGDAFRTSPEARPANAVVMPNDVPGNSNDWVELQARPANAVVMPNDVPGNSNDWVELHKPTPPLRRHSVSIGNGDSLYSIFKSNGFALAELAAIIKASKNTRRLTRLVPGQRLDFHPTADNSVSKLVHYLDDTRTLHVKRNGVGYDSKLVAVPLDRHMATAAGTIDASLFVAGQRPGHAHQGRRRRHGGLRWIQRRLWQGHRAAPWRHVYDSLCPHVAIRQRPATG